LVFSSIQHQVKEHVVTDSDLKANQIMISLEPSVNHLEEVVVRQYSLTGTLEEDLDKIPTYTQNLPFWSAAEIDGFKKIWKDDAQSNVKNLVLEDNTQETPIDFIAIGKLLAEIMNIKTKTKFVDPSYTITDFYDEKFVVDILEIPKTSYYDFIDFVDEDSRTAFVLKLEDKLKILEYLMDKRDAFVMAYGIKK